MADVVIVGGGVIGLTTAYELSREGAEVAVLDQSAMGREASWAGAGMLPPGLPESPPQLHHLMRASRRRWPDLSRQLLDETGIDNGFRTSGGLQLTEDQQTADAEVAAWSLLDVEVESLTAQGLQTCEPALGFRDGSGAAAGYRLPEKAQVRNPHHLSALIAACVRHKVQLRPGQPVVAWSSESSRITAARTPDREFSAEQFLITAGAWSSVLLRELEIDLAIEPIRGQIVLVRAEPLPFTHILEQGARYLVPRPDGRILIGSTQERVGFVKENTAEAVGSLLGFAIGLVPQLAHARIEKCWSGLRPAATRGRPLIGQVSRFENLFIAAGHFRDGLAQSPATASVLCDLLNARPPRMDVSSFALDAPPE